MDVALSGEIFPVGEEGYASDAFFAGCVAGLYRAVRQDILQCGNNVNLAPTFAAKYKTESFYWLLTLAPSSDQFFANRVRLFCIWRRKQCLQVPPRCNIIYPVEQPYLMKAQLAHGLSSFSQFSLWLTAVPRAKTGRVIFFRPNGALVSQVNFLGSLIN